VRKELTIMSETTALTRNRQERLALFQRPARSRISRRFEGFTLIEIMVVVVILGLLAAIVAPRVMDRLGDAQIAKAKQDIQAYETALKFYYMDNYRYPTTEQGLQALVVQPNDSSVRNWREGGYIDGLRKDPWGNDYVYVSPGQHRRDFDLYTRGADGQDGGEGPNADIGNWNMND